MKLACVAVVLLNLTDIPFNKQDYESLSRAQVVCGQERYDKGCVKEFQKREQGVYRVECGNKELFDRKVIDIAEKAAIMEELKHLKEELREKKLKAIGMEE